MIADKLKASWEEGEGQSRGMSPHVPTKRQEKDSFPKWNRSTTWALDKDGVHFPPLLANSAGPKQRIPPDAVGRYHGSAWC
jgi:hypothetical protein